MKTEKCQPFEYCCQVSSKSIHIISSYTVSKLGHFLRHSVHSNCKAEFYTIFQVIDNNQASAPLQGAFIGDMPSEDLSSFILRTSGRVQDACCCAGCDLH